MTSSPELNCHACHRPLYGPVRFCPYCGIADPAGIERAEKAGASLISKAAPESAIPTSPQPIQAGAEDDGKRWESACRLDTVDGYREYLQTNTGYKKGHSDEAERRIEQLAAEGRYKDETRWKEAQERDTVEAYREYLDANLHVKTHERDARTRILELVESQERENRSRATPGAASVANAQEPPSTPWIRWIRRHWALIGMVLIAFGVVWAYLDRGSNTPEKPVQSKEVSVLLEQAREDISNHRLSTPPGNNALEKFQRVLALQAGNSEALLGIKTIGQQYEIPSRLKTTTTATRLRFNGPAFGGMVAAGQRVVLTLHVADAPNCTPTSSGTVECEVVLYSGGRPNAGISMDVFRREFALVIDEVDMTMELQTVGGDVISRSETFHAGATPGYQQVIVASKLPPGEYRVVASSGKRGHFSVLWSEPLGD